MGNVSPSRLHRSCKGEDEWYCSCWSPSHGTEVETRVCSGPELPLVQADPSATCNGMVKEALDAGSLPKNEGKDEFDLGLTSRKASEHRTPSRTLSGTTIAQTMDAVDSLSALPDCPTVGCSFAFLQEFARSSCLLQEKPLARAADSRVGAGVMRLFRSVRQTFRNKSDNDRSKRAAAASPSEPSIAPRRQKKKRLCMGDVCNDVIKPNTLWTPSLHAQLRGLERVTTWKSSALNDNTQTEQPGLSYAELGMQLGLRDPLGRPAFQKATHFVSHAWSYDFDSFVSALGCWVEQSQLEQKDVYFWVDAFVVNQHQTQYYPKEWWCSRFMQAVGDIGNTVLVLEPWDNPVPLQRAWVLWEVYCTQLTGARLHLAMHRHEMERFRSALVNSFEEVQTALSHVDVHNSQAFHQNDRHMIHSIIESSIGFTKMNEMVQMRLRTWLMDVANKELNLMRREGKQERNCVSLQDNIARMLRESGNLDQAVAMFRSLLQEIENSAELDVNVKFNCMNQLAVTLQKKGSIAEALEMHRKCMHSRRQVLGESHDDTLQSASNLAVLLSGTSPLTAEAFVEARELYIMSVSGREATLGPDHPRTLYTVSNFGMLLSMSPEPSGAFFEEAETLHARAVRGLINKLHESHPLTLSAMHSQGRHWLLFSTFEHDQGRAYQHLEERAVIQLRQVHTSRIQKIGQDHPDTIATSKLLRESKLDFDLSALKLENFKSWKDLCLQAFPRLNSALEFKDARKVLMNTWSVSPIRSELVNTGFIDANTETLTTGTQPFNFFARIGSGGIVQPNMVTKQAHLGPFEDRFVVACNRPEAEEMWWSDDPAWLGKASLGKRHLFITLKNLHWEWFNILTFGFISGREAGIAMLEDLQAAAVHFATAENWSARLGLYLHVYGHCSVNSFHLHVVDLDTTGPTFKALEYKNLPLVEALQVLRDESSAGTALTS